jgi:hypothetical protein
MLKDIIFNYINKGILRFNAKLLYKKEDTFKLIKLLNFA